MIVAQLSIAPIGVGASLSAYVKIVIETLKKENIKFTPNAMSTVIETEDLETLFHAVQAAHKAMVSTGAPRVITELKIDDRQDKVISAQSKLDSIS